ncbi:MAG: 2-oxo acid dehydrogenase subunit E2, partial [Chloroflexi bacterium]|nr:2-oxo acid dehydrogenase subunit E2 [Chloroflexota bacterium]
DNATQPSSSSAEATAKTPSQAARSATIPITPVAARVAADLGVDVAQVQGTGPGGRITRDDIEAFVGQREGGVRRKVRAAPAARRLARELGIDLSAVEGSGPRGRVQSWDVQAAQKAVPAKAALSAPEPAAESGIAEVIPLQGMRRTIARRMQASTQQAPHITFNAEIDVTAIEELRHRLNAQLSEGQARVSITAILVKACAWALRRNPRMNARLDEDRILVLSDINVGVAVALDDGLIVPVIHQADAKGILELAAEVTAISRRAHSTQLRSQDLLGGTFTISNLGMFGVDSFTAIINPPETGILAVGRIIKRLVVTDEEEVEIRPMMTITLSADHRTVDGAIAAHFLNDLRAALEYPALMTM